jgi:WD40 repeat protein
MNSMKNFFALALALLCSITAVGAQVNTINSVVFGTRVPRFMADPTGGLPVRNTSADFLSVVPSIAGAKVITFSPCSDAFITVSGDTASLWNSENGVQNMALQHGSPIKFVAYAVNGTFAVTSGGSYTRVWSAPKGEFRYEFTHQGVVTQMVLSPDSQKLAIITPTSFEVWSLTQGVNLLRTPVSNAIRQFIFNPNGKQFLTLDGSNATLWTAADGQPVGTIHTDGNIVAAIFSPDGSKVICASDNMSHIWDTRQFIKIADVQFGGGYK